MVVHFEKRIQAVNFGMIRKKQGHKNEKEIKTLERARGISHACVPEHIALHVCSYTCSSASVVACIYFSLASIFLLKRLGE